MCYCRQTCSPQCPKARFYDFLLLISCLAIFLLLKTLCFLTNNLRGLPYINVIFLKLLGTLRVAHNLKPVPFRKAVKSTARVCALLKHRLLSTQEAVQSCLALCRLEQKFTKLNSDCEMVPPHSQLVGWQKAMQQQAYTTSSCMESIHQEERSW